MSSGGLQREAYFPTLIHFVDLSDGVAINAGLKPQVYAWRANHPAGIVRSNANALGAWHSADDLGGELAMAPLAAAILLSAASIFDHLGYDPAYEPHIANIWANINPRGAYNRGHVHPNTLWSGVYYVQAPPECGAIVFHDPRAQAHMVGPVYGSKTRPPELWSEVTFQAIEGRLILFPSWLLHEVQPNLTPLDPPSGDRISVSFNLIQRRKTEGGR